MLALLVGCGDPPTPPGIEGCLIEAEGSLMELRQVVAIDYAGRGKSGDFFDTYGVDFLIAGHWVSVPIAPDERERVEAAWRECRSGGGR